MPAVQTRARLSERSAYGWLLAFAVPVILLMASLLAQTEEQVLELTLISWLMFDILPYGLYLWFWFAQTHDGMSRRAYTLLWIAPPVIILLRFGMFALIYPLAPQSGLHKAAPIATLIEYLTTGLPLGYLILSGVMMVIALFQRAGWIEQPEPAPQKDHAGNPSVTP